MYYATTKHRCDRRYHRPGLRVCGLRATADDVGGHRRLHHDRTARRRHDLRSHPRQRVFALGRGRRVAASHSRPAGFAANRCRRRTRRGAPFAHASFQGRPRRKALHRDRDGQRGPWLASQWRRRARRFDAFPENGQAAVAARVVRDRLLDGGAERQARSGGAACPASVCRRKRFDRRAGGLDDTQRRRRRSGHNRTASWRSRLVQHRRRL
jgi:hypothetical protein